MLICPAVHIPTRSLLRSSSTPEPSDPLYSIAHAKTVDQNLAVVQRTFRVWFTATHGGEQNETEKKGEDL